MVTMVTLLLSKSHCEPLAQTLPGGSCWNDKDARAHTHTRIIQLLFQNVNITKKVPQILVNYCLISLKSRLLFMSPNTAVPECVCVYIYMCTHTNTHK